MKLSLDSVLSKLRKAWGRLHDPYDYSSHVFAYHHFQLIYMAVPKVANTSIKIALAPLLPKQLTDQVPSGVDRMYVYRDRSLKRLRWKNRLRILKHQIHRYPDYFVFTFVRNPWDRLVSCYHDKIASEVEAIDGFTEDHIRAIYRNERFEKGMSFEDFVYAVCAEPDRHANRHFRSQSTFLVDKRGRLLPNFVGRFERLRDDFAVIREYLDRDDIELPHVRATRRATEYRDYYSTRLRRMVAERYAEDIHRFEYEF